MLHEVDKQRMKMLLSETMTLLCKDGLHFDSEFRIEALVGITLDRQEVILFNINETVSLTEAPQQPNGSKLQQTGSGEPRRKKSRHHHRFHDDDQYGGVTGEARGSTVVTNPSKGQHHQSSGAMSGTDLGVLSYDEDGFDGTSIVDILAEQQKGSALASSLPDKELRQVLSSLNNGSHMSPVTFERRNKSVSIGARSLSGARTKAMINNSINSPICLDDDCAVVIIKPEPNIESPEKMMNQQRSVGHSKGASMNTSWSGHDDRVKSEFSPTVLLCESSLPSSSSSAGRQSLPEFMELASWTLQGDETAVKLATGQNRKPGKKPSPYILKKKIKKVLISVVYILYTVESNPHDCFT